MIWAITLLPLPQPSAHSSIAPNPKKPLYSQRPLPLLGSSAISTRITTIRELVECSFLRSARLPRARSFLAISPAPSLSPITLLTNSKTPLQRPIYSINLMPSQSPTSSNHPRTHRNRTSSAHQQGKVLTDSSKLTQLKSSYPQLYNSRVVISLEPSPNRFSLAHNHRRTTSSLIVLVSSLKTLQTRKAHRVRLLF